MALSTEQLNIAATIDGRVHKLLCAGNSDLTIFLEMADYMPDFKQLMDTAGQAGMDELTERYTGFFHYAKILERIALDLESGEIRVPE
jgi:hypothetical protein